MEGLNRIYGRALDLVVVPGSFRPNGATGIVANSTKGQGFSVARTSAGLYTVTFDEKWPSVTGGGLIYFGANGRISASEDDIIVKGSVVSQSAKTAQIRVFGPGGGTMSQPIDITAAREIASNAIQNLAAHGGIMAVDSDPRLERINGATDPNIRLRWGSASLEEIQLPNIPIPVDLDPSEDVYIKFIAGKSGDSDATAALVFEVHEKDRMDVAAGMWAQGDSWPSNLGGSVVINNTLDGQGIGNSREYSLTLAAAGLYGGPGFFTVTITAADTHNTAAIDVYAMWLEYTSLRNGRQLVDLSADADNEIDFVAIIQDSLVAA